MQLDDLKTHVRMLVLDYSVGGKNALTEMSESDRRLLLSEKQIQLARLSSRCVGRAEPDFVLKAMLEFDVMEIGETLDRGPCRER